MKLKVPLLKQKYKTGCGLAAMSMVYKYFGKKISQEEISKEIGGLTKWGSFMVEHAFMARKLGFKVICHSYNLEYFDPSDAKLSRKGFIKKTKALIKKEKRAYNKRELKSILKVLESDIEFKMKMPSLKIIKKFLDKKIPVVVAVNSAILCEKKKNSKLGHYIVLTGYKNDKFYYNDPKDGKAKSISADKLIFALSNNVFDSSAYLIVIKPTS
jgi:ABC-type bacteriocin/lantibiotic exporter with double-glycine peptidase domain